MTYLRLFIFFSILTYTCGSCPANQFECDSGDCKLLDWKCDGVEDCKDGSDELDCKSGSTTAATTKLTTKSGSTIPDSDTTKSTITKTNSTTTESSTTTTGSKCSTSEFRCNDGLCIPGTWRCDKAKDCIEGEDEENCDLTTTTVRPKAVNSTCFEDEFKCKSDGKCIRGSFRCDRKQDCDDLSDEINCSSRTCRYDEFRCTSTRYCIFDSWKCDNKNDCLDNSDEEDCEGCGKFKFMCDDGLCLEEEHRCNRLIDCLDGSDEENCTSYKDPVPCNDLQFACKSDGKCIPSKKKCNLVKDCDDASDEFDCNLDLCSVGEFRCNKSGNCLLQKWVCDGFNDCFDGSDEHNCTVTPSPASDITSNETKTTSDEFSFVKFTSTRSTVPFSRTTTLSTTKLTTTTKKTTTTKNPCSFDEFHCKDEGKCISEALKCNRKADCKDLSDEMDCNRRKCKSYEFQCKKTKFCIFNSWKCDNRNDCLDGSDEENCPEGCADDQFKCADGLCLPLSSKCDKLIDCFDGSDEVNCTEFRPTIPCNANQFTCKSDFTCIPKNMTCNKVADCNDKSDEYDCNKKPCEEGEFRCEKSGFCLKSEWVCDGFEDCFDKSDENNCTTNDDLKSMNTTEKCDDKSCPSHLIKENVNINEVTEFHNYQNYSIWLNIFPRKWLRAKEICKEKGARLVEFPYDKKFSQQFLRDYITKKDVYGLNFWIGKPIMPEGTVISKTAMKIPNWLLNGREINNTQTPMYEDDCYFMEYSKLEIFISRECYDHAAFICERVDNSTT